MTTRITKIEYAHDTGVFTVQEVIEGDRCEYQTKNIWQVIQRIQDLVYDAAKQREGRA